MFHTHTTGKDIFQRTKTRLLFALQMCEEVEMNSVAFAL